MKFTYCDIEKHNIVEDCWTIIDNKVFDISSFVKKHPGGNMILHAAGTEGTVLYHTYHLNTDVTSDILNKHFIGFITDKSYHMGDFFYSVRKEVNEFMKINKITKHPTGAIVSLIIHFVLYVASLIGLWKGFTLSGLFFMIFGSRLHGFCHATGHCSIFRSKANEFWSLLLSALPRTRTGFVYTFPVGGRNERFIHQGQKECTTMYKGLRGPAQHTAVHHVLGALPEYDPCHELASFQNTLRIERRVQRTEKHDNQHTLKHQLGLILQGKLLEVVLFLPLLFTKYVSLTNRKSGKATTGEHLLSFFACVLELFTFPAAWLILHGLRHGLLMYAWTFLIVVHDWVIVSVYYGEHVWDTNPTSDELRKDWGKVTAATSSSLQPTLLDTFVFFFCLGAGTLDYHLEHTLFPGMNYLNLKKIAPVVERNCRKFNVPYTKYTSCAHLFRVRKENLSKLCT